MQEGSEVKKVKSEAMEDWLLVQKAQKDAQQFAALYDKYWEVIYRFVYKRLADEALVKDVCQHVFIKALNNISKYQYKGFAFSSWLFRIAISEISNIIQVENRQRAVKVNSEDIHYLFDESSDSSENPDMEKMVGLLQELSETDLAIVEMRFFEKIKLKDIAVILDISESNCKVKMHRILKRLKKKMLA